MAGVTVIFWRGADGSNPVADFIRKQSGPAQQKITRYLRVLEEHDPALGPLPQQYAKTLRDGILELRPEWSNVEYRLLFAYLPDRRAVVLLGFIKKSRHTPNREIERARELLADYQERRQR
jgi:phage-related protein